MSSSSAPVANSAKSVNLQTVDLETYQVTGPEGPLTVRVQRSDAKSSLGSNVRISVSYLQLNQRPQEVARGSVQSSSYFGRGQFAMTCPVELSFNSANQQRLAIQAEGEKGLKGEHTFHFNAFMQTAMKTAGIQPNGGYFFMPEECGDTKKAIRNPTFIGYDVALNPKEEGDTIAFEPDLRLRFREPSSLSSFFSRNDELPIFFKATEKKELKPDDQVALKILFAVESLLIDHFPGGIDKAGPATLKHAFDQISESLSQAQPEGAGNAAIDQATSQAALIEAQTQIQDKMKQLEKDLKEEIASRELEISSRKEQLVALGCTFTQDDQLSPLPPPPSFPASSAAATALLNNGNDGDDEQPAVALSTPPASSAAAAALLDNGNDGDDGQPRVPLLTPAPSRRRPALPVPRRQPPLSVAFRQEPKASPHDEREASASGSDNGSDDGNSDLEVD